MKKRKARRYQEGGDIPDIDREPLRDSQGNIVRSGIDTFTERFNINRGISPSDKGEPVMSGSTRDRGYGEAVALGRRMREERDAAAMDEAMLRRPSEQKTTVAPVKPSAVTSASVAADLEEPGTAGFSRTLLRNLPAAGSSRPAAGSSRPVGPPRGGGSTQAQKPVQKDPERAMGRTAMGKTAEQEMAAIAAARQAAGKREIERLQKADKPLERVSPEEALIGGAALRGLKAAGAGLAGRMGSAAKSRVEPRVPPRSPDLLEMPKRRLPYEKYMGEAETVKKATPRLAGPQEGAKRLSAPPRGGGKDPGARRPTRDELDEMRMGSDFMRKGGKVGSASRRADGIAMRGKTRGKYI